MNENQKLIERNPNTDQDDLIVWQAMIENEEMKVGEKIRTMYFDLLKSIVDSDLIKIGKLCEKNLYREF